MTRSKHHRHRPVAGSAIAVLAMAVAILAAGSAPLSAAPQRGDWRVTTERYDGRGARRDIDVSTLLLERALPLRHGLFVAGGLGVVAVEGGNDAAGAGAMGSLRWEPGQVRGIRPFVAGGTGMVFTTEAVPPGGERSNFWHRVSLGLSLRLRPSLRLIASLGRLHVSGGRWLAADEGRHLDGNGVALGLALRQP